MVDFTQPINNRDMVRGLNALIHRNVDLSAYYDKDFARLLEDRQHVDGMQALKKLHERHAQLLGDTVRLLGGAPDYSENRHRWIDKSKSWFGRLRHDAGVLAFVQAEEEKLQAQYQESLQALKASPESVGVINQALEERETALRWLRQATRARQE